MYLRIETELHLKRLIVAGWSACTKWAASSATRAWTCGTTRNSLPWELYQAYTDYFGMMELIEALFKQVAQNVLGTLDISYQGEAIHLGGEWPRMTMKEAVKRYAGVDFDAWQSDEDARQAVKQAGFEPEKNATKGECLNQLFEETVEQTSCSPRSFTITPLRFRRWPSARRTIPCSPSGLSFS